MDRILYLVITNSVACVVVGCAHARQYVMGSNPKKLNQCPIDMILWQQIKRDTTNNIYNLAKSSTVVDDERISDLDHWARGVQVLVHLLGSWFRSILASCFEAILGRRDPSSPAVFLILLANSLCNPSVPWWIWSRCSSHLQWPGGQDSSSLNRRPWSSGPVADPGWPPQGGLINRDLEQMSKINDEITSGGANQ